jgi:pimeloyl-ACP methyl ester carboxylesterase
LQQGRSYYDPARLAMPVLLVRGEWDAWPGDADYRTLQAAIKGATYVTIARGTHVMHLEAARVQLYETVRGFLD